MSQQHNDNKKTQPPSLPVSELESLHELVDDSIPTLSAVASEELEKNSSMPPLAAVQIPQFEQALRLRMPVLMQSLIDEVLDEMVTELAVQLRPRLHSLLQKELDNMIKSAQAENSEAETS